MNVILRLLSLASILVGFGEGVCGGGNGSASVPMSKLLPRSPRSTVRSREPVQHDVSGLSSALSDTPNPQADNHSDMILPRRLLGGVWNNEALGAKS
jgi:hypothetical protein